MLRAELDLAPCPPGVFPDKQQNLCVRPTARFQCPVAGIISQRATRTNNHSTANEAVVAIHTYLSPADIAIADPRVYKAIGVA